MQDPLDVTSPSVPAIQIELIAAQRDRTETTAGYAACLEIRRVVFSIEQRVSLDLEFDGLDDESDHFIAWRRDSETPKPIGTARMRRVGDDARAERVSVVREERRHSTGSALMAAIESRARALGLSAVVLHAQVAVIPFYTKLGYDAYGEVFVEADIPHRNMRKSLA